MSTTSDDIPDLSAVRLTETVEGIEAGSYGTVVQIYQSSALAETGYAVEFSNPSRVVVVARSQIEPEVWTEEDLRAADAKAEELHRYFHPTASPAAAEPKTTSRWVLVPIETTDAMRRAYWALIGENDDGPNPWAAWAAMIAAVERPVVDDHTERARRVIALVDCCAGDTALLVGAVAAEFSAAEHYADRACEQRVAAMVQEFLDCAKYDALMEGPLFKTWDRSALDRLRKKYEAMLEGWVATAFSPLR